MSQAQRRHRRIAGWCLVGNILILVAYVGMFVWTARSGSDWWWIWLVASVVAVACLANSARIYDRTWGRRESGDDE